jgi:hypothetical protein
MITPDHVIRKIRKHGSESLSFNERVFVVEVFRAAALTGRREVLMVKNDIQKAHLEYCLSLTEAKQK